MIGASSSYYNFSSFQAPLAARAVADDSGQALIRSADRPSPAADTDVGGDRDLPARSSEPAGALPSASVDEAQIQDQPGQDNLAQEREKQQLLEDQRKIAELSARDREVRAHEQAHAAVGGSYAGAPRYQTERGPDGVNYAVGGEVSIDVGRAATPQETILKAQIVRRAALAPAEPSPQDRKVAAQASQMEAQARNELRTEKIEEADVDAADAMAESDSASAPGAVSSAQSSPSQSAGIGGQSAEAVGNDNARAKGINTQFPADINSRAQAFIAVANIELPRSGSRLDQVA